MLIRKIDSILEAFDGLSYQEWHLIADAIEHTFQQKMNQTRVGVDEVARVSARMHLELAEFLPQPNEVQP